MTHSHHHMWWLTLLMSPVREIHRLCVQQFGEESQRQVFLEFGLPETPGCQSAGSNSTFGGVAEYPGFLEKRSQQTFSLVLFFYQK